MYQVGQWLVYGVHGVCRVLGTEKQLVNRKRTEYLVLEPLAKNESKFYVPTANAAAMAKLSEVMSGEQLQQLLTSEEIRRGAWIEDESRRKQFYRDIIGSGDREALIRIIWQLYRYKEAQLAAGRKFHQSDDNFLRDAERLVASEIALVMDKTPEAARDYLREQLK